MKIILICTGGGHWLGDRVWSSDQRTPGFLFYLHLHLHLHLHWSPDECKPVFLFHADNHDINDDHPVANIDILLLFLSQSCINEWNEMPDISSRRPMSPDELPVSFSRVPQLTCIWMEQMGWGTWLVIFDRLKNVSYSLFQLYRILPAMLSKLKQRKLW